MRVYCRHLQQKRPQLLPQTLPAPQEHYWSQHCWPKGSQLWACTTSTWDDPTESRTLVCSCGTAGLSPAGSELSDYRHKRSSDPANSFPSAWQPLASSCVLHTADKGLFYFLWPQEIKFIFVTMYLIFWVSFRMIVCHSCIPQCKPENHWAMS